MQGNFSSSFPVAVFILIASGEISMLDVTRVVVDSRCLQLTDQKDTDANNKARKKYLNAVYKKHGAICAQFLCKVLKVSNLKRVIGKL